MDIVIICVCLTVIPLNILSHEGNCLHSTFFGNYTGILFLLVFLLTSQLFHKFIKRNVIGITGFTAFLCPFLIGFGFIKGNRWCLVLTLLFIKTTSDNYKEYKYDIENTTDRRYEKFLKDS